MKNFKELEYELETAVNEFRGCVDDSYTRIKIEQKLSQIIDDYMIMDDSFDFKVSANGDYGRLNVNITPQSRQAFEFMVESYPEWKKKYIWDDERNGVIEIVPVPIKLIRREEGLETNEKLSVD